MHNRHENARGHLPPCPQWMSLIITVPTKTNVTRFVDTSLWAVEGMGAQWSSRVAKQANIKLMTQHGIFCRQRVFSLSFPLPL